MAADEEEAEEEAEEEKTPELVVDVFIRPIHPGAFLE